MNQKKVFIVLGMPRSGTSVVSRGLKALGIDLGDKLTPANQKWNPKGFWEDNEIVYKVNARVLEVLNIPWDALQWFSVVMTDHKLNNIKKFAEKILLQRFSETKFWGFKDPNTVKLLHFWQPIFETLNIEDHYIITLRNPLSSAQSYHHLTNTDVEQVLLNWLMSMMAAVERTQGKSRVLVSYDLLIKNPRTQLDRIRNSLNITLTLNHVEIDAYINYFIDKTLYHYEDKYGDLQCHPAIAVAPLCLKMYDLLFKVANDRITLEDSKFISEWLDIRTEFNKILPIYSYIGVLLQQNNVLRKSLRTIHRSRLWKAIAPVRWIDDTLRVYRRKRKEKRVAKIYE